MILLAVAIILLFLLVTPAGIESYDAYGYMLSNMPHFDDYETKMITLRARLTDFGNYIGIFAGNNGVSLGNLLTHYKSSTRKTCHLVGNSRVKEHSALYEAVFTIISF